MNTLHAELETIVERVQDHAMQRPEAVAYRFIGDGERETALLSFQDLNRRACGIAAILNERNIGSERVLLLLPQDLRFVCAFLGCLYAGAIAVPVMVPGPNRPPQALLTLIADCSPRLVLTTRETRDRLHAQLLLAFPDMQWCCIEDLDQRETEKHLTVAPESIAFLQYTSGSTGTPKGVMVTHANLAHNIRVMGEAFKVSSDSVYGGWLPTYHDMGLIGVVLASVWFGVPSVLMPPLAFLQKPMRWLRMISTYGVTISGGPDFGYALCAERSRLDELKGVDLSRWAVAFNGSETVRKRTIDNFCSVMSPFGFRANAMYPCYGMAESTLFLSGGKAGDNIAVLHVDGEELRHGRVAESANGAPIMTSTSCGHVWGGMKIAIVDPVTRKRKMESEVGEIWAAGGSVALGYYGNDEATEQTFHASIAGEENCRYLRTGDLGFLQNGQIHIAGRLKDTIVIRGRNYYPQDIEDAAIRASVHLYGASGAAFSVESGEGERLVLVQELRRAALRTDHAVLVREIQRTITAEHGISASTIVLVRPASIPRTSSGKLRRKATKELFMSSCLAIVYRHENLIDMNRNRNESRGEIQVRVHEENTGQPDSMSALAEQAQLCYLTSQNKERE